MSRPTLETDAKASPHIGFYSCATVPANFARALERERNEAREALREIWQSGDAFLPHVDSETTNRWRKAAGWEET
jgi:hypothetical protein